MAFVNQMGFFGVSAASLGMLDHIEAVTTPVPSTLCSVQSDDGNGFGGGAAALSLPPVSEYPENLQLAVLTQSAGEPGATPLFKGFEGRAPRSFDDFTRMFATEMGIRTFLNAEIVNGLAQEWEPDELTTTKNLLIHAYWTLCHLEGVRTSNRTVLQAFETANPGREPGSVLATLARETHESWLAGEKASPSYVPYTQALQDFLAECIQSGVLVSSQKGKGSINMELFVNPKKKHKFSEADFRFGSEEQRAQVAARFTEITGRAFDGTFLINTVAGDWDVLSAIAVPSNAQWAAVRPGALFNLQADSVAAVLSALQDTHLLNGLGQGSVEDKLQVLVEILRRINVGWRVNNPWNGFNSPLQNRPFDLNEFGGIGIADILRDARTLRPILEGLERFRAAGRLNADPQFLAALERAFANGLQGALDRLVDEEALTAAIRINRQRYQPT